MEVLQNNKKEGKADKFGSTKITIEEGENVWIHTPRGIICVYVGESYSSITSWVDDTHYAGFFTNNATKKTTPCNDKVKHIQLTPKGDY